MPYQDHEQAIQRSLNFIEQYLTEPLHLNRLAEHAGYSRFRFNVSFERSLGNQLLNM